MFVLAFVGIAASDVSTASQTYWSLLAIVFGLICLGLDWVHEPRGTNGGRPPSAPRCTGSACCWRSSSSTC